MKIIIIGASSGIGKSVAESYASKGHIVGITGRRLNLLEEMASLYPENMIVCAMDVADAVQSKLKLQDLIANLGGVDLIIINAGVGYPKATLDQELQTIAVNVHGFTNLARFSYDYFVAQGGGQLAGVSSVAAVRSSPYAPEYHGSKAYMSSYLEGLRLRSAKRKHRVFVTDIRPGFVETAMTRSNKNMFWLATPKRAAFYIIKALEQKKKVAYITPRYWFLAQLLKVLPEWLIAKII